ncbi:MAG: metallophosphoesterase [Sulfurospirillum sp.]|nr:metallophosphoesterase [Sulfurospirillum sp.]
MARLIVYGDIHGCLDELIALRKKIGILDDDIEVCVGDVITKGNNSLKTLKFLRKKGIFCVLGNNEEIFLRFMNERENNSSLKLDQDKKNILRNLSIKDWDFLRSLPYFIQIDRYTIVHGGLQNSMNLQTLSQEDKDKIIKMRYLSKSGKFIAYEKEDKKSVFWADLYDGKNGFVIYGHQRFKEPKLSAHAIGIDTGCVYGQKLTALIVEEQEMRFVNVTFGEQDTNKVAP